ncbi:MAG TPA: hypothetical protein VFV64_10640 [Permianibacter sp.]|nr:hypothetical protein [Permianibacter sp.]
MTRSTRVENTGAVFSTLPQIPPRNVNKFRKGNWLYLANIAFEKRFLPTTRSCTSKPVYEKYVLTALSIEPRWR